MNAGTDITKTGEGITLVLGGTGKTGRRVAEKLQARGVRTRVASRSADQSFDWNDQSTWDGVLAGVSAVYVNSAPDLAIPGARAAIRAFTAKAVAKGVQRLVLLLGRGEEEAQACERVIQEAGVEWTVVRASWLLLLIGAVALPGSARRWLRESPASARSLPRWIS